MNKNVTVMITEWPPSPRVLLSLCALLGALMLLTFGCALWQWHSDWVLTHAPLPSAVAVAKTDETMAMISALPADHLFGKSFADGPVPITSLQLRVTGIVKAEGTAELSKAYISIAGQPGKIFRVGDNLTDGVKVYDITQDSVILENDSHLEKLPLPREGLHFKSRNTSEEA